jgi:hypothetical protein
VRSYFRTSFRCSGRTQRAIRMLVLLTPGNAPGTPLATLQPSMSVRLELPSWRSDARTDPASKCAVRLRVAKAVPYDGRRPPEPDKTALPLQSHTASWDSEIRLFAIGPTVSLSP